MELKGVSRGTMIRTIVLVFALINQLLTSSGRSPLPSAFGDADAIASVITTVAALAAWWKNNSFTSAAIRGDELIKSLKRN